MRIALVAGEPSGDVLGARLLAALRARNVTFQAEGVGGPQLQSQGLNSVYPMERLSVMGLVEPLRRLPELLRLRQRLRRHFLSTRPDVFLGIDSPDFNLALERSLKRSGIPAVHLVSPSVWAWRPRRIDNIARSVDHMMCLFPFEPGIYERSGIAASFVGHPLADEISAEGDRAAGRAALGLPVDGKVLALLPGSRASEVNTHAPLFVKAARQLWRDGSVQHCVLPVANDSCRAQLGEALSYAGELPLSVLEGQSRLAMTAADAVLAGAGTATLEAALLGRPAVVAYRTGALSWAVLSRLVKTPYVALPNILSGERLMPELLQNDATVENVCRELAPLLAGRDRARLSSAFDAMRGSLSADFGGVAGDVLLAAARPSRE